MQRHKSVVGSMNEILDFEYDSSASTSPMDHRMQLSNVGSPKGNSLTDILCNNLGSHESHYLSRWDVLEPGSSSILNDVHRDEEDQNEQNLLFLQNNSTNQNEGCWFMQNSTSNTPPQSLSLNAGLLNHVNGDFQVVENPTLDRSKRSMNETSANCSLNPFGVPSGTGGYLMEDDNIRPGFSLDGRRLSRKRKTTEENVGQSSASGSSRWHGNPSHYIRNRNLCISSPSENGFGPTHLGHMIPNPNPRRVVRAEPAQRNRHVSNNPVPMNLLPPTRNITLNPSLDLSSTPRAGQIRSQPARALPQNVLPIRHIDGSSLRHGTSTTLNIHAANGLTNSAQNPVFVPASNGFTNSAQNPTHSSASSFRPIPRSRVDISSISPTPVHLNRNPTLLYPQRLSDYVQRSVMPSIGSGSGGTIGSHSTMQSGALADQGNNRTRQSRPVSGGTIGSLRSLASSGEERSRLASEIRSFFLDLMRRGEVLRREDVMILNQSVLFGMAAVPDRHRDMRLDVDNMSYEELLALEERIGNVSTGLSEETVLTRLKRRKYVDNRIEAHSEAEPCSICQEEYKLGEDLGSLKCGHDFHTSCIKQWLEIKNLCPICKTEALIT